jgi:hypothetical protein
MYNPFKILSEAFHPEFHVNFSIERLDGSIMLTLTSEKTGVIKRLISPEQRNDPQRLQRLIDSVRFGIAIDAGHSPLEMLNNLLPQNDEQPRGAGKGVWAQRVVNA